MMKNQKTSNIRSFTVRLYSDFVYRIASLRSRAAWSSCKTNMMSVLTGAALSGKTLVLPARV